MASPAQTLVFVTQCRNAVNTVGIGLMLAWNPLAVAVYFPLLK